MILFDNDSPEFNADYSINRNGTRYKNISIQRNENYEEDMVSDVDAFSVFRPSSIRFEALKNILRKTYGSHQKKKCVRKARARLRGPS